MIDKQTISKESFLLISPKEELRQLKKQRKKQEKWSENKCMTIVHGIMTLITITVVYGFVSLCIESGYIDMTEFIAASMMFPDAVLRWFQEVDLVELTNVTWPVMVIVFLILVVAKLKSPKKDD